MENIKTIAFRGSSDLIGNLQLCIDHISYAIPNIMNSVSGQYNAVSYTHLTLPTT